MMARGQMKSSHFVYWCSTPRLDVLSKGDITLCYREGNDDLRLFQDELTSTAMAPHQNARILGDQLVTLQRVFCLQYTYTYASCFLSQKCTLNNK